MYRKEYIVSNNDVDTKFNLKVPAIFRYFQDVALLATEEAQVDSMSLSKKNIDWVITRMAVEIERLPKCNEVIYVHTYPGKDMAMLYPRYFFITDKDDNVIVRSSSIWALIDNNTRKVIVDRDVISKLPEEKRFAFVHIDVVDSNGIIKPHKETEIEITNVKGAKLLRFGNAASYNKIGYMSNRVTTYHGMSMAIFEYIDNEFSFDINSSIETKTIKIERR